MPRPVALAEPDPRWTDRAEALIADLRAAAPEAFAALHHIGSTAVPGLVAKPVIDLLGEAVSLTAIEAASAALHPGDSGAYAACKKDWTDRVAAEAVGDRSHLRRTQPALNDFGY